MHLNLFSLAGLILSITCFVVVILVLIYGKKNLHRAWTLFNIAVGLWGLGAFYIGQATNEELALIEWRFAHIGIIFISVFIFHVAYLLCNLQKKYLLIFAYVQGILFSALGFSGNFFISGVRSVFSLFYYLTPGITYPIFCFEHIKPPNLS